MKTRDLRNDQGQLTGFSVGNLLLSRHLVPRIVADTYPAMKFHSTAWADMLKVLLKLLVLAPVVFAFSVHLHRYRSPEADLPLLSLDAPGWEHKLIPAHRPETPDQTTIILVAAFGATACLGVASLLFQYTFRRCEHTTSIIFFGVVGHLVVVNIVSELLGSGLRADLRIDYALMVAFFTVSVCGVWLESYNPKKFHEAKIG
jgi:hypothetical protein